jgi:hypothetical protein
MESVVKVMERVSLSEILVELFIYAEFLFGEDAEGVVTKVFRNHYPKDNDNVSFRLQAIKHIILFSYERESENSFPPVGIKKRIRMLPWKYKVPLLLNIVGKFKVHDISILLGVSAAEAESRLFVSKLAVGEFQM